MKDVVAFVDQGLGNSAYLVDLGDGRALVIDPTRDPIAYLDKAEQMGLRVAYSVETHLHADFVTGSRELALRGAEVIAPRSGGIDWPHKGLSDGDEVDLGGLRLRAVSTPGHTPEHLSYLVLDGSKEVALFSGGSLLVGSVARTDLIAPEETDKLARQMWRSVTETLLSLPDEVIVYPTHGAGSFCSAPAQSERTTTIGRERKSNPLLKAPDEDAFVKALLASLGSYPTYFSEMRDVNRKGPHVYGQFPALPRLSLEDFRRLVEEGAVLIDARKITSFSKAHIPGALSIELRPQFASWLGWIVDRTRQLVFVCDGDTDRHELVRQCLTIGYERIAGELDGGMARWQTADLPVSQVPLVYAQDVQGAVVDVRQDSEFRQGHLPGALHIELGSLASELEDLPMGSISVMCGHGERAMTGASLVAALGKTEVAAVIGGPDDWSRATGEPLRTDS